jgi:CheY-like chemotaxis protein
MATSQPGARLQILVAEDNPVNQLVLEQLLLDVGHSVQVVSNGRIAVDAVKESVFDLVLMDIQMPEMDGVTATKLIRAAGGGFRQLPIIAVTANTSPDDRDGYLAAGMDAVIAKPFKDKDLFKVIASVMRSEGEPPMAMAASVAA